MSSQSRPNERIAKMVRFATVLDKQLRLPPEEGVSWEQHQDDIVSNVGVLVDLVLAEFGSNPEA